MEKFIEIKDNENNQFALRLKMLLGTLSNEDGGQNYFEVLNHEIKNLNQKLVSPKSQLENYQKAYQLQEQYNDALQVAKLRWGKANKEFDLGANLIKDLAARKKMYEQGLSDLQATESKYEQMSSFIECQKANSPWHRLQEKADELDKNNVLPTTRSSLLKKIRLEWKNMGSLAKCNAKDLLNFHKELINFEQFIDFIRASIPKNTKNNIDIKLLTLLSINARRINRYQIKLLSSMKWKLKSAILNHNLRCDDSMFALTTLLKTKVFEHDKREDLYNIIDLIDMSKESIAHDMEFSDVVQILKIFRDNNYTEGINIWLESPWIKDQDNKNLIKLNIVNSYAIPSKLKDLVPDKIGFGFGAMLRYWYFRTHEKLSIFWSVLRNMIVGDYNETAAIINETNRQVAGFDLFVQVYRRMGYAMNLNNINKSSAFLAALQLPKLIELEKTRASTFKPSWFAGVLFKWIPLFNRAHTYQFFSLWDKELQDAKQAIDEKCANITQFILEDFEVLLMNSITQQSYLLTPDLMSNIQLFISTYGKKSDIDKLKILSDPINILQKFEFLHPAKEGDVVRHLNDDALFSFLQFAQKYWTNEQYQAVKAIVDIIMKASFPIETDDNMLTAKLACLLKGEDKNQAYKKLMNLIAVKYIFSTGDDGNEQAFEFLKRFAPRAARNWQSKRQNVIDEKFIILNSLLSVRVSKERDLSKDDLHETRGAQLKYKNYAMYINDIKNQDMKNKGKNLNLLIKKARDYVEAYQGGNVLYADLLLRLCLESDVKIIARYIQKRFSFLLGTKQEIPADSISVEEHQLYYQISKNPTLVSALLEILNKKYHGENTMCAELILTLNHPDVTACYFSRRWEKLLRDGDYHALVQDKKLYSDFLINDKFVLSVNKAITLYIESLVNNQEWDKFESADFCHLVEIYGNTQNKETYRLLIIKRLLSKNNVDSTKAYFGLVTPYLHGNLENELITLEPAKKQLTEILQSHVDELREHNRWEGHAQYFLEYFLPSQDKKLLYDIRFKWLEEFFNNPTKFTNRMNLEQIPLDAKYHYQNKDIPNDAVSLEQFYGKRKIPLLKNLMMQYIDNLDGKVSDEHIKLISSYLKDNAFALDADGDFFCKKFENYQKIKKIIHCISNGLWLDAIAAISHLSQELKGLELLQLAEPKRKREKIIHDENEFLNILLLKFENQYKGMLVNETILSKIDLLSFDEQSKLFLMEKDKLHQTIQDSELPDVFKEKINQLHLKSSDVFEKVTNFVGNLHFNKLHLISFNEEDVVLFSNYLSRKTKKYIINKMKSIQEYLSHEDPLHPALSSFMGLMMNEYQDKKHQKRDLIKIRQFRSKQKNYPALANVLATKLISSLDNQQTLINYSCFNEKYSTCQSVFLHYLKKHIQIKLMSSLENNILLLSNATQINEIIFQRDNWLYHGILYEWLMRLPIAENSNLKANVSNKVQLSIINAKKSLQSLIEKFDLIISNQDSSSLSEKTATYYPKPETINNEQKLIQTALFIRSFGDEFQKKVLDDLLAQVAKRQRRCMMKGLSGSFFEHCLDYADKLIMVAGSPIQRSESEHLIETWNRYRTVSLRQVRELAIEDALPQYIKEFDKSIYQYFIKRHNLSDDFSALMHSKFEQWNLSQEMIVPNQLLKKHPIKEFHQILLEESKKRSHGFFYSKPSERDANKLFVAFCLHLQAHQLVSIWNERKKSNQELLNKFTPQDISEPLNVLVNNMSKKFDIGRGEFNRSIHYAISKNDEYFASWSIISEQSKKLSQVTQTVKRVASR
ncbi:MAG: hypothetical protein HYX61_09075 [Gammaproteobacteria bacterium]|jgi:hypothetical protein|nr:hypothetical protein [Gammaproteobacteria bacterium]